MTTSSPTITPASTAADIYARLNPQAAPATDTAKAADSADRFLKMLVAQMQNQDPLNPMDNAQVTSQMAQINAVTGLEKVNTSVQSLNGQMLQMQAMQGAGLIDREVALKGNRLSIQNDTARGGYDLQDKAAVVDVEILNASGKVVKLMHVGPQDAGRHDFSLPAQGVPDSAGYRFRVTASNKGEGVDATEVQFDHVDSVSTSGNTLKLNLSHAGDVPATAILSFN